MKAIKIGTNVVIRKDLVHGGEDSHGTFINEKMAQLGGTTRVVSDRTFARGEWLYHLDTLDRTRDGNDYWFFSEEMLEQVDDNFYEHFDACIECGSHMGSDRLIGGEHVLICDNCFKNKYFECGECGETHKHSDKHIVYLEDRGHKYVCSKCLDKLVASHEVCCCDRCHVHGTYGHMEELDGHMLCRDCASSYARDLVLGYSEEHEDTEWQSYDLGEHPKWYIGHELEVENEDFVGKVVRDVHNKLNVVLAHDGSLDGDGEMEIISHPQSFDYIMSMKDTYKEVLEELRSNGYTSHDNGHCGLHFHVTRPYLQEIKGKSDRQKYLDMSNDIIDRIILFMETYKSEVMKFSRRSSSQMRWCKFYSEALGKDNIDSLYYIKKRVDHTPCAHGERYYALNLTNKNTIEFRIFRGTLNYETFMASVEFVNNIMTYCSDLSIPIEDITWDKVVGQGEFIKEYCESLDIASSTKRIVDNSAKLIEFEKNIQSRLKTLDKYCRKLYNLELQKINKTKLKMSGSTLDTAELLTGEITNRVKKFYYTVEQISRLLNAIVRCNGDLTEIKRVIRDINEDGYIKFNGSMHKEIKDYMDMFLSM